MLRLTLRQLLRQLIYTASMLFLCGMATSAHAGEAGHIVFVVGQVQIGQRPAVLGNVVQEGDEMTTGSDGYMYLKTIDNGFLILRPASRARIVTYKVDKEHPTETKIKLELLEGVARSISGQAVKLARQNFRFNTPVAAIGVRGTDFTVFTDQQTSRVTVLSGGVVVGGFSGSCSPEGGGPCEGNTSLELFANQTGQLLQIQKGQAIPQLLRNTSLAPDAVAPPRGNEPNNKSLSSLPVPTSTSLNGNDVSLDPQKNQNFLSSAKLSSSIKNTPEGPIAVVTPELIWGRWQAVANLGADTEALAKLKNGSYEPAKILDAFFISRPKQSELVLPKEGQAAFALIDSEAYIVTKGQTVPATVQDGRLDIDFAKRAFSTNLTVTAPNTQTQVDIQAKGDVTLKGELLSSLKGSNASVSGYLGGANAKEAAYLFKSIDTPAATAFGATRWGR